MSDRWGPLLFGGDPYPHLFLCVCCWGEGGGVERYWCQKKILFGVSLELKKTYLRQYSSFTGMKSGIGDYGTFFLYHFHGGSVGAS